jgi:hypothetical protein
MDTCTFTGILFDENIYVNYKQLQMHTPNHLSLQHKSLYLVKLHSNELVWVRCLQPSIHRACYNINDH